VGTALQHLRAFSDDSKRSQILMMKHMMLRIKETSNGELNNWFQTAVESNDKRFEEINGEPNKTNESSGTQNIARN
jgi:hypothetical protein